MVEVVGCRIGLGCESKEIFLSDEYLQYGNDRFKYEYITKFFGLSHSEIGIKVLGKVDEKYNINFCNANMLIILRFSSNDSKDNFIQSIFKKIRIYKKKNSFSS